MTDEEMLERLDGPVHGWFGLSYANYAVLPRSLMQSMPVEWQERFVALADEFTDQFEDVYQPFGYSVRATDGGSRYVRDPVPHYDRGRTFVKGRR